MTRQPRTRLSRITIPNSKRGLLAYLGHLDAKVRRLRAHAANHPNDSQGYHRRSAELHEHAAGFARTFYAKVLND